MPSVSWVRALLQSPIGLVFQGHRFYRSPARFCQLSWAFLTNFRYQIEISRMLCSPDFAGLVRLDPIFPLKYLTRGYLVPDLSWTERAVCFLHHYRRMKVSFSRSTLEQILYSDIALLEKQTDEHLFAVRFGLEREQVREGELALDLQANGETIYTLQFTIVPGWAVKSRAEEVFLISRLQGMKGYFDQVRLATRAFLEIAPPALLLAVLQGIALVCGVEEMAGVSAKSQFCYAEESADSFRAAYDNFWSALGAKQVSETFYASPIPTPEKSLDTIRNGHKSRTRKKREFKKKIAEDVFHRLLGTNPALLPSLIAEAEAEERQV